MARQQQKLDTFEKDRHMIEAPMEWPRWPVLPLTRRNGGWSGPDYCGFILSTKMPPYLVYVATMYALKPGVTLLEAVSGLPTKQYASLDELLIDWRVD